MMKKMKMMKMKTGLKAAAASVMTALAALTAPDAFAADVSVYGVADLGLSWQKTTYRQVFDNHTWPRIDDRHWSMASGNRSGSRFGLKGREDLGNGWTVGFVLENGFDADTGALKSGGTLFDREATLSVSGPFGTVYAGRMGTLMSDAGSVGFYAGAVNPFGTGIGDINGLFAVITHPAMRVSNAVAYVTPTVSGFTGYAQVAMGDTDENTSRTDRYAAIGLKYERGPLTVAALVDYVNRRSSGTIYDPTTRQTETLKDVFTRHGSTARDDRTVNLGGSYDFGFAKVYAAGQYFRDAGDPAGVVTGVLEQTEATWRDGVSAFYAAINQMMCFSRGFGLSLGVSAPVAGGTAKLAGGAMRGRMPDYDTRHRFRAVSVLAGYEYPLSPRTSVYAAAGFTHQSWRAVDLDQKDYVHRVQATAGFVHRF